MLPDQVVYRQVFGQVGNLFLIVSLKHGLGAFLAEGLDEPLGLAAGWLLGLCVDLHKLDKRPPYGKVLRNSGRFVFAYHLMSWTP